MPGTHGLPAGARPSTAASRPPLESLGASFIGPPSVAAPAEPPAPPAPPVPDPVPPPEPPVPMAVLEDELDPVLIAVVEVAPPPCPVPEPLDPAEPVEFDVPSSPHPNAIAVSGK